jgi:DNA-binding CsgD family transcriptional regulator
MVGSHHGVTPAEREVLRALAFGKTDEEIAAEFGLPLRTVQGRLERFYGRTGIKGRRAVYWSSQSLECCLRSPGEESA